MVSFPSIFNDVLGPVMRGPSSSHSAASLRIGRMALDLMDSDIKSVTVDYDPNGSLVTTHLSQGCLLYPSAAADDTPCVDLGGRRISK